ncbi:hypothetical protein KZ336_04730, partial [Glaesserella parasuis]|nr:hypothetical protein [Glaesserella parasuis]
NSVCPPSLTLPRKRGRGLFDTSGQISQIICQNRPLATKDFQLKWATISRTKTSNQGQKRERLS